MLISVVATDINVVCGNTALQDSGSRKQCRNLVYKFLFIPVLFLVLRIWTCVLLILYTYVGLQEKQVPQLINKILLYLSVRRLLLSD